MCRQNIHTKVTVICFVLLLLAVPIFSASGDFHNVHIGYTIFGYKSYEELNKALNPLGIETSLIIICIFANFVFHYYLDVIS